MKIKQTLFLIVSLFFLTNPLQSSERVQMIFKETVHPTLKAELMVVGSPEERKAIQTTFKKVAKQAQEIFERLTPLNEAGETAALLKKGQGDHEVSPDLAKILYTAQEVAKELKEPMAKEIKVDLKNNRVAIQSNDLEMNIEPLLIGYLTDRIAEEIAHAGWQNLSLNVGGIYVTKGNDFNGPWKIPVADNTTQYAQRTFMYKANNTAVATVHWTQGGTQPPNADLKSVTIFSKEGACKAQGLAVAAYALGLQGAKKFVKAAGVDRAVLIDYQGRFVQIPEK